MYPMHYLFTFISIYGLREFLTRRKETRFQGMLLKLLIAFNLILLLATIWRPANYKVLFNQQLFKLSEAKDIVALTKRENFHVLGGLRSTFYKPQNSTYYSVDSEKEIADFLKDNDLKSCYYLHQVGLPLTITGYTIKKVYSFFPDVLDNLKQRRHILRERYVIYLISKEEG